MGRQIYEDTNTVSLPLVFTESKLIMLLHDASVCTAPKNFEIPQVKKTEKEILRLIMLGFLTGTWMVFVV